MPHSRATAQVSPDYDERLTLPPARFCAPAHPDLILDIALARSLAAQWPAVLRGIAMITGRVDLLSGGDAKRALARGLLQKWFVGPHRWLWMVRGHELL